MEMYGDAVYSGDAAHSGHAVYGAMSIQSILQTKPATLLGSLEAALLLAHVLGFSRSHLIARSELEIDFTQQQIFKELVKRRLLGEPIAYLTGEKEFWSLSFLV